MGDKHAMETSASLLIDPHSRVIVQNVAELLRTGYCADLTIRCSDGAELRAHRVIVCRRSLVIAAACDGSFEEARTGLIKTEEFDGDTMRRMLAYLYSGNYDDRRLHETDAAAAILTIKAPAQKDAAKARGAVSARSAAQFGPASSATTTPAKPGAVPIATNAPTAARSAPSVQYPGLFGSCNNATANAKEDSNDDRAAATRSGSDTGNGAQGGLAANTAAAATAVATTAFVAAAADAGNDPLTAALVANVRVYVAGDYYDLPTLRELALAKLKARVCLGWPSASLVHVLELVTQSTRADDGDALHDFVMDAAVEHAPHLIKLAAFRQLLAAGGPLPAAFIEHLMARHTMATAALQGRAAAAAAAALHTDANKAGAVAAK